jgi:hypothetical protein
MNCDIPEVGNLKTDMGVRGGKPTVVEALKRGASRTPDSCVNGTPFFSSWLAVVIYEPLHLLVPPQALQLHLGGAFALCTLL